jgi:rhodanese-related sulfurtransferase
MTVLLDTPPVITGTELRSVLDTDPAARVLDVRTPGEFQAGHIPGSYNVPLDTFGEHGPELARLEHPVVLVCQSGARASDACERLTDLGGTGIRVLDGGITSWIQAGGETVTPTPGKWSMDRQVRLAAGSLVLGSILAAAVAPRARLLAGAVGAGLAYSAVSNTCAMANLLGRLPYNRGTTCDVAATVAEVVAATDHQGDTDHE